MEIASFKFLKLKMGRIGPNISSCMMLEHIGETSAAKRIRLAIDAVYTKGDNLTGDMAQKGAAAATTTMFTQALCEEILRAEAKAA